ncbi:MAG: hypothetical protein ABFS86_09820 [Planctomycetota bacterium]
MNTPRVSHLALLFLIALAGCRSTTDGPPDDADVAGGARPEERFLDHPTVVRGETIAAILPADLESEVEVSGLSAGWREENGKKIWEGRGGVEVKVRKLVLAGKSVNVTLVAEQKEREVVIQASGDVSFSHAAPGGTQWEGKDFLMIRNDRWLER